MALKNLTLKKAKIYLQNVLDKKDVVPLRRFCGSAGRSNLCKNHNYHGPGRFPEKSVKHLLDLLSNAESNAEVKSLDTDKLSITHIQVNQAQHGRRRTYRAHGRINAYMSSPCHVEVILTEKVCRPPCSSLHGANPTRHPNGPVEAVLPGQLWPLIHPPKLHSEAAPHSCQPPTHPSVARETHVNVGQVSRDLFAAPAAPQTAASHPHPRHPHHAHGTCV